MIAPLGYALNSILDALGRRMSGPDHLRLLASSAKEPAIWRTVQGAPVRGPSISCAGANLSLETEFWIPFEFRAVKPPDRRKDSSSWRRSPRL